MNIKTLFTIFLLLAALTCFSQKKTEKTDSIKKTVVQKPYYRKFVAVDIADFNTLIEALNQWKRLCLFDPNITPEQKVQQYQNIETYGPGLMQRIRLDSALHIPVTPPDTVKAKPKKKK